jgi:hypothetical protein
MSSEPMNAPLTKNAMGPSSQKTPAAPRPAPMPKMVAAEARRDLAAQRFVARGRLGEVAQDARHAGGR